MKSGNHTCFEITAVAITVLLKFILMDWLNWRVFYLSGAMLFWVSYIVVQLKTDREIVTLWGLRNQNLSKTVLFLAPFVLITIAASLIYNTLHGEQPFSWQFIMICILYPFWGMIQQFILLALVLRNLLEISQLKRNRYIAILLVATAFSLVHFPDFFLMVLTFFMELVFIMAYFRSRNLWAIGTAHGWIATFVLYFVLHRNLWSELFSLF